MSKQPGTGSLAVDGRRSIAGAVISNAATFLVALLIARLSGEALLGAFAILFALRAIIALICGLGMRIAMTKFVAASRARADYAALRGAVRVGVGATGVPPRSWPVPCSLCWRRSSPSRSSTSRR